MTTGQYIGIFGNLWMGLFSSNGISEALLSSLLLVSTEGFLVTTFARQPLGDLMRLPLPENRINDSYWDIQIFIVLYSIPSHLFCFVAVQFFVMLSGPNFHCYFSNSQAE